MRDNYYSLHVNEIVESVSETHSFKEEKLYAVNTSDVENGRMLFPQLLSTNELKGQFKKAIRNGDILFSEIRPANRHFAVVNVDEPEKYVASTKLMVLRKYNDAVNSEYFYYWLTNSSFLKVLQRRAENRICSFPQITFELLSEYTVPVPDLETQRAVAHFLSTVDAKLDNNNAICANLEGIAKLLYDYWFVQFDFPNEDGRPYKSSGGKMVWNAELKREIPVGWNVKKISDISKRVKVGFVGTVDKYYCSNEEGYPIVRPAEMSANGIDYSSLRHITKEFYEKNKKSQVNKGDILISRCGKDGIPNTYDSDEPAQVLNAVIIEPNETMASGCFINEMLKSEYSQVQISHGTSGSVQGVINTEMIAKIIMPYNYEVVCAFSKHIKKCYSMIVNARKENDQLTSIRDYLLPMLMNGQVRIP